MPPPPLPSEVWVTPLGHLVQWVPVGHPTAVWCPHTLPVPVAHTLQQGIWQVLWYTAYINQGNNLAGDSNVVSFPSVCSNGRDQIRVRRVAAPRGYNPPTKPALAITTVPLTTTNHLDGYHHYLQAVWLQLYSSDTCS